MYRLMLADEASRFRATSPLLKSCTTRMVRPWPSCWLPTRTLPPRPQWEAVSTHVAAMTEPEQKAPLTETWAPHGAPPGGTVEPPMIFGVTSLACDRGAHAPTNPATSAVPRAT